MQSKKSRLAAAVLALLLGAIGIHRFYVGKIGTGIVMLLLAISFIGLIVSSLWAFIDFICILTGSFRDGDGKKISDW